MTTFNTTTSCNDDGSTHVEIFAVKGTDPAVVTTKVTVGGSTHTFGALVPGQVVYSFDTSNAGAKLVHAAYFIAGQDISKSPRNFTDQTVTWGVSTNCEVTTTTKPVVVVSTTSTSVAQTTTTKPQTSTTTACRIDVATGTCVTLPHTGGNTGGSATPIIGGGLGLLGIAAIVVAAASRRFAHN